MTPDSCAQFPDQRKQAYRTPSYQLELPLSGSYAPGPHNPSVQITLMHLNEASNFGSKPTHYIS